MFQIGLVEDNPAEKLLIEVAKEDLNFSDDERIHVFESEDELYNFIDDKNNTLDLLLIDVNIGYTSGFDVLKKMKSENHKFPIVMYSNSNNPNDLEQSKLLKADSYIQKPYDFHQLTDLFQNFRIHLQSKTIFTFLSDEKLINKYGKCL